MNRLLNLLYDVIDLFVFGFKKDCDDLIVLDETPKDLFKRRF